MCGICALAHFRLDRFQKYHPATATAIRTAITIRLVRLVALAARLPFLSSRVVLWPSTTVRVSGISAVAVIFGELPVETDSLLIESGGADRSSLCWKLRSSRKLRKSI